LFGTRHVVDVVLHAVTLRLVPAIATRSRTAFLSSNSVTVSHVASTAPLAQRVAVRQPSVAVLTVNTSIDGDAGTALGSFAVPIQPFSANRTRLWSTGSDCPARAAEFGFLLTHRTAASRACGRRLSGEALTTERSARAYGPSTHLADAVITRAFRAQRVSETRAASAAPTDLRHQYDHTCAILGRGDGQVKEKLWPT
jgi:hypothetical protein